MNYNSPMVNFKLKVQLLCMHMMYLLIEIGVIVQLTKELIPIMTQTFKTEKGTKQNLKNVYYSRLRETKVS